MSLLQLLEQLSSFLSLVTSFFLLVERKRAHILTININIYIYIGNKSLTLFSPVSQHTAVERRGAVVAGALSPTDRCSI